MSTRLPQNIGHTEVFRLAWPIMVSMLSYTAMGLADSLFVAHLGTAPLAAVGLAATGVHLLGAFPLGVIGGARVQIAQAFGAAEVSRARVIAWQGLWFALGCGLLVIATIPLSGWFAAALGADGELADHAVAYLEVRNLAAPLVFTMFALQAWYQGRGDTRTPMVAVLVANAVNIGLDPVLIFGWAGLPELGVRGAAGATLIALVVQNLVLLAPIRRSLLARPAGIRWAELGAVWRTGLPMGTGRMLDVLSFVLFAALLAHSGDAHLAAHVIVVRIATVSFLPGHAIGEAAGVLVGQSLGAGRPTDARRAWWAANLQAMGVMSSLGVVFLTAPGLLVGAFHAEPEVARIATEVLVVAAFIQVFDSVAMVSFGSLNGAGDTRFTMIWGLAVSWLAKVPVSALGVLGLEWGATGAWLGIAAEIVLLATVGALRVRGSRWLGHAGDTRPSRPAETEAVAAA